MASAQCAIRSRSSTGRPKRIANTSGGSGSAKAATNSQAPPDVGDAVGQALGDGPGGRSQLLDLLRGEGDRQHRPQVAVVVAVAAEQRRHLHRGLRRQPVGHHVVGERPRREPSIREGGPVGLPRQDDRHRRAGRVHPLRPPVLAGAALELRGRVRRRTRQGRSRRARCLPSVTPTSTPGRGSCPPTRRAMPFVTNRGQRIHYTLDGDGPLVVLQHGYLSSAADWKTCGYVDVLTEAGFRVACVDSLAHGESDKPTDPALYALPQRADDIVAVLDDLGADRAHLVGYSMGGWIAGGVADAPPGAAGVGHDRRLGLRARHRHRHRGHGRVTVDAEVDARGRPRPWRPTLVAWVTPEVEEAVLACGDAITERRLRRQRRHQRPRRAGAVLERRRGPVPPDDERVGPRPRPPVLLGARATTCRPSTSTAATPPPAWPTSSAPPS